MKSNGMRVNEVVQELRGEKIDIINWSDNPAILIENALSPAKVITVLADEEEKTATVIVPDTQLSLAIGKEGQNARLAAKLTGFKIDIINETQGMDLLEEYYAGNFGEEEYGQYDEEGLYEDSEYYDDSDFYGTGEAAGSEEYEETGDYEETGEYEEGVDYEESEAYGESEEQEGSGDSGEQ